MKKKYEVFMYSLLEFPEIEKRLEERAAEGWRLKKTGGFFWVYEEAEPKQVHYSIVFFPKTDNLQPEPSDSLVLMREYCEKTGWKLVAELGQMQIFCNEQANPVPIETESWIQVKNIHKTMKKGTVMTYVLLLVNAFFQLGLQVMQLITNPLGWLEMGFNFYLALCWIALGGGCVAELVHYFLWYKKAKRMADEEETLYLPKSMKGFRISYLLFSMMTLSLAMFSLMNFTSSKYILLIVVWTFLFVAIPVGGSKLLKKWKVSAKWNRAIIIILAIICIFGMSAGIVREVTKDADMFFGRDEEMTLKLSDFREVKEEILRSSVSKSDSLFLTREDGYQSEPWKEDDEGSVHSNMEYTLLIVKSPVIYDFCKESLMEERNLYVDEEMIGESGYRKVDMPEWEAKEVYRYYDYEGDPRNEYLICYSDCFVRITFGWMITEADVAVVKEAILK